MPTLTKTGKPRKRPGPRPIEGRAKKLIKNLTSGKFASRRAALRDAGYSDTTKAANVLNRPLVKSALTEAMDAIGLSLPDLVQPIKDALLATRSYVDAKAGLIETKIPDHKIRLEASRDGVAIFGGIPKVGEGTPTAHGLNLFVAIDNGPGGRVQVASHSTRSTPQQPGPSQHVSIAIKDEGPRNVQAHTPRPAPRVIVPDADLPDPALND